MRPDEFGVEELVTVLKPAPIEQYSAHDVYVPTPVARILRPHQREGVQFLYECVMGLKDYKGRGVILADGMSSGRKQNKNSSPILLEMSLGLVLYLFLQTWVLVRHCSLLH
jgi:hypothetical protein